MKQGDLAKIEVGRDVRDSAIYLPHGGRESLPVLRCQPSAPAMSLGISCSLEAFVPSK